MEGTTDGVTRVLRGTDVESPQIDPKLWFVQSFKTNLGDKAVESLILGLSRPVKPTHGDAELLISEWERRDTTCCFTGSVKDLLSLKQTCIVAVSYKHDERSNWGRKRDERISKMMQVDQEELINCIVGLGRFAETSYIMVWCDQILTTRCAGGDTEILGWYNVGLLPYLCLPVLTLSEHITKAERMKRIWILAERTLGELGTGLLIPESAKLGTMLTVQSLLTPWQGLYNISLLILSGYWPEDTGIWASDYRKMKTWALALACRSNQIVELRIEDDIKPIDNLEILANLYHFAMVPQEIEQKERHFVTDDLLFFLKPMAWNPSLHGVWNENGGQISHYLGRAVHYKFSWWIDRTSQNICGIFLMTKPGIEGACFVLAVKHGELYQIFRRGVHPHLYVHQEAKAGPETTRFIEETANYFGIHTAVNANAEWPLLFFCDECTDMHFTDKEIKKLIQEPRADVDALVPLQFVGQTTSIYRTATGIRRAEGSNGLSPEEFVSLFHEWNHYVLDTYAQTISVRDTRSGPVWLEGFDEECVSFGFLDFMTRYLITGDKTMSRRVIKLPTKWEALQEIRKTASVASNDLKVIADELFGDLSEQTCDKELTTADVARFIISGGFTSGFGNDRLASFLAKSARVRGYWSTDIHFRDGKMQILFLNKSGNVGILQRSTKLDSLLTVGIVHPKDSRAMEEFTEKLEEDPDLYRAFRYWKDGMEDNTTKKAMRLTFKHSHGKRKLCSNLVCRDSTSCVVDLVDMSVFWELNEKECLIHDAILNVSTNSEAQ